MTQFLFVRHGETCYKEVDERGFVGQGRSLAKLTELGINQIKEIVKDDRLRNVDLIISSPYTRALQSAAILSKDLNIELDVEIDLHEWVPDIVHYNYKTSEDCFELGRDYDLNNGVYPKDEVKVWESKESMKKRMDSVLEKYIGYSKVIVVCHGMIIRTQKNQEIIKNGEIIEFIKE